MAELQIQVQSGFLLKWVQREFGDVIRAAAARLWENRVHVRFLAFAGESRASRAAGEPVPSNARRSRRMPAERQQQLFDEPATSSTAISRTAIADTAETSLATDTKSSPRASGPVERTHRQRPATADAEPVGGKSPLRLVVRSETTAASANGAASDGESPERRFASLDDYVPNAGDTLVSAGLADVLANPGRDYSPLYLHGGVGVGKTHLLEGLYRRFRQDRPGMRVLLMSAETFANQYTAALRDRSTASFRLRFRNIDAILMDDFDFFNGKSGLAREFLSTLKHLEGQRKQVVLTADRHPRLIAGLDEEIVSRCLSGLVCRLDAPNLGAREEILRTHASRLSLNVASRAIKWIAQRFEHVREGQGAINTLATLARSQPAGRQIGLSAARTALAELDRDCTRVLTLKHIESAVCRFFDLAPNELRSGGRKRTLSQPRMLAMFLARKHTQSAYAEIGEYFGGRNHSTVISAERKVHQWLADNGAVQVTREAWTVEHVIASLERQFRAG